MALISAANPQFPRAELIVSPSSARPVCVLVTQLSLILCNPMDCSPPDSSVHGLLQARIHRVLCTFVDVVIVVVILA